MSYAIDLNGDGLQDLSLVGVSPQIGVAFHNGAGQPPDLLSSVADGYGVTYSPTYVSIVQSSYTVRTDGAYPDPDFVGPTYVVNQFGVSGVDTPYTNTFTYAGAHANLQGRGFDGFYSKEVVDSRNSVAYFHYYRRDFPFVGLEFEELVYPTSHLNYEWQASYSYTLLDGNNNNQRYFDHTDSTTSTYYELGGPRDGQMIKTVATNYTYDSWGNALTVTQKTTDNDSTSPYYNQTWTTTVTNTPDVDTYYWCLNLFSATQIAYTGSGTSSVTRTKSFTADTANCRYTQAVTEPSSAGYKVTEDFGFDAFGNINSDTVTGIGMAARQTTTSWGTTGQFPMTVNDQSGAQTQLNYNFSFGVPSSLTDPNNLTTSWQYSDGFGRKTKETRPDGTSTVWTYALCPTSCPAVADLRLWVNQQILDTGSHVLRESHFYYDYFDSLRFDQEQNLDGTFFYKVHQGNDILGRLILSYIPSNNLTDDYHWITYDAMNRPILDEFVVNGSVTKETSTSYGGDTTTTTDPQNKTTTQIRTAAGTLGRTQDHNGYYENFTYDSYGSLIGVSDSLGNTLFTASYSYGLQPFQTDATDMDLDVSTASGHHRHYVYDALGEVTNWSDAKGQNFSQTYDLLSRPLVRTEPDLTTTWTWGSNPANHEVGQLASVSAGSYSEQYSYDASGRPSRRRIITGTSCDTNANCDYDFSYNGATGLLDHLQYPQSPTSYRFVTQYGYSYGLLSKVSDYNTPSTVYWQANTMNAWGELTQETLGSGSTAVITNRSYFTDTGWLSSTQSGVGGGATLQNDSYLFDLVGNLTQRQNNNRGLTENFYYDNLYRLDHSTIGSGTNLQMGYDAMGNIAHRSDVAGGATWTYDTAHKHAVTQAGSSSFAYTYDPNGNMSSRQGTTINWSSYNYPTSISAGSGSTAESVTFSYGPDRQRLQQVYSGNSTTETTLYIGGLLERVSANGVTDYRHYIYAGNKAVAVYSRKSTGGSPVVNYLLSDHLGGVASIVSNGSAVVTESFTAYGARRDPTTWSGAASNTDLTTSAGITRQGYTFQTALGLWMGLNHMSGRVEDAIIGRFLSPDPAGTSSYETQSFNRYSYALNNPLTYRDPSGFFSCDATQSQVEASDPGESPAYDDSPDTPAFLCGDDGSTDIHFRLGTVYDPDAGASFTFPAGTSEEDQEAALQSLPLPQVVVTNGGVDQDRVSYVYLGPTPLIPTGFLPLTNSRQSQRGDSRQSQQGEGGKTLPDQACNYANEAEGESSIGALADAAGLDDNLVQLIDAAGRKTSIAGFAGEAASVTGTVATGLAAADIAGQIHSGHILDANLSTFDFTLGLLASKAGPRVLAADTAYNAAGGSKAIAKGIARGICALGGRK